MVNTKRMLAELTTLLAALSREMRMVERQIEQLRGHKA